MNVTGYALREALKLWELKRDALKDQVEASLYAFPGEEESVRAIVADLRDAEEATAEVQTVQAQYNASVTVFVPALERSITLTEAVKRLGGLEREERLWKWAATKASAQRVAYGTDDSVRKADEVRKQRVLSVDECVTEWVRATKATSAMRSAVAVANATARDIPVESGLLSPA